MVSLHCTHVCSLDRARDIVTICLLAHLSVTMHKIVVAANTSRRQSSIISSSFYWYSGNLYRMQHLTATPELRIINIIFQISIGNNEFILMTIIRCLDISLLLFIQWSFDHIFFSSTICYCCCCHWNSQRISMKTGNSAVGRQIGSSWFEQISCASNCFNCTNQFRH